MTSFFEYEGDYYSRRPWETQPEWTPERAAFLDEINRIFGFEEKPAPRAVRSYSPAGPTLLSIAQSLAALGDSDLDLHGLQLRRQLRRLISDAQAAVAVHYQREAVPS